MKRFQFRLEKVLKIRERAEQEAKIAYAEVLQKKNAFEIGNGKIPVQRLEDFCKNRSSEKLGCVKPQMKGSYQLANVRTIFPDFISETLLSGKILATADNDLLSNIFSPFKIPISLPLSLTAKVSVIFLATI